jgi:hypothetical protein
MPNVQLCATARPGDRPLESPPAAAALWMQLRRAFVDVRACVLLPGAVHLVADVDDPVRARVAFEGMLETTISRAVAPVHWHRVPPALLLRTTAELERAIRATVLAPCRTNLVCDPLDWMWTTLRDVVGHVADPWLTAETLADALGCARHGFARRHHQEVMHALGHSTSTTVRVPTQRWHPSIAVRRARRGPPRRLPAA